MNINYLKEFISSKDDLKLYTNSYTIHKLPSLSLNKVKA